MNKLATELAKLDALLNEPVPDVVGLIRDSQRRPTFRSRFPMSSLPLAERIAIQERTEDQFEAEDVDRLYGREEETE